LRRASKIDTLELKKLESVTNLILSQLNEHSIALQERRKDLRDANKAIWADKAPVISDMDDAVHLITLSYEIAQHEREYIQANRQIVLLKNMLDSPYFARIDFKEEGYDDIECIYIGKNSLYNNGAFEVYDWRAPISSLYYDFGVGRASFNVVHDKGENEIAGEVLLKRQYRIVRGKLVYLFDSELAIDDDILQIELSKTSDARIKSIIHTIQAEQNKAIRSTASRLLVYGPAGSGKTSVGLHRLAYLLYKHRGSLTSAKVRIFSPSPIFASYIDGIIPELGEDSIETLDFTQLLLGYGYKSYDKFEQLDFLEKESTGNRAQWFPIKTSAEFTKFLENFVRNYSPAFDDIYFNRDLICDSEHIKTLYQNRTSAASLYNNSERVIKYVSRTYDEYFAENKKNISIFFNNLEDEVLSDGSIRHRFEEQKNITIADLRNRLMPDSAKLYEKALRAFASKRPPRIKALYVHDMKLFFEDALALFFIDVLTGRVQKDRQVKHILIDEAQDMSTMQHKILQNLYGNDCDFTVLGDVNQALYPMDIHENSTLQALYQGVELMPLNTSYRSTYEISKFASNILGIKDSLVYSRHGDEPQIIKSENPLVTTAEIVEKREFNTLGILFSTSKKAQAFYDKFKDLCPQSRLIANQAEEFEPGVMVMAVPFAKGLEFDVVICPEYGEEMDDKVLYLICTRALHELYMVSYKA